MGKSNVMRILRQITEIMLPILFWALVMFGFDSPSYAILTVIAAIIHELGHITALLLFGGRISLRSHISGFRISTYESGYIMDIAVLCAGPIFNLLVFAVCLPFGSACGGYIALLGNINLLTALFNLIPIEGYDGYGIIRKLLEMQDLTDGVLVLRSLSLGLTALLTLFALYLIFSYGVGYWIFGIFFVLLVGRMGDFLKHS